MRTTKRNQAGYNLVEVLIAMALLGVVTISIFTLFYMGRANVYSGKQLTQALAVATQVQEDLAPLNKEQVYAGVFGIVGTTTGASFTIPASSGAITYPASRLRSSNPNLIAAPPADISTQNTPPGLLTKWTELLGTKLTNGSVSVILTPEISTSNPVANPPTFAASQLLRIRAMVRWTESGRQREVVIDSVKAF